MRESELRASGADRVGMAGRAVVPLLIAADVLTLELFVLLGMWLREAVSVWFPISLAPVTFHGIHLAVLVIPLGCLVWGLYPGYGLSPVDRLRRRTLVVLVGFGLMDVYDHLGQNGQWSRGVLVVAMALAVVGLPITHAWARRTLLRLGLWGEKVVLLGDPERCRMTAAALSARPDLGWIPAGIGNWPLDGEGHWNDAEMAILLPLRGELSLAEAADSLPFRRMVVIPDLGGRSLGVSSLETGLGLGLGMRNNLLYPVNRMLKRSLDLVAVLLALPLALPVIAAFALAVKVISPGPAFYGQQREGLGGRPFRLWKIRSMTPDAETRLDEVLGQDARTQGEWKSRMKLEDDPRIIPGIGRFMRRFSIDELPQLLNVLLGHMSLVGPRPLPAYHLAEISPALVALRQQVRPGITGWAQISGRSHSTVLQQVEYDAYYIRNWSFWIDSYVLARTVEVVLSARGAF